MSKVKKQNGTKKVQDDEMDITVDSVKTAILERGTEEDGSNRKICSVKKIKDYLKEKGMSSPMVNIQLKEALVLGVEENIFCRPEAQSEKKTDLTGSFGVVDGPKNSKEPNNNKQSKKDPQSTSNKVVASEKSGKKAEPVADAEVSSNEEDGDTSIQEGNDENEEDEEGENEETSEKSDAESDVDEGEEEQQGEEEDDGEEAEDEEEEDDNEGEDNDEPASESIPLESNSNEVESAVKVLANMELADGQDAKKTKNKKR